MYTAHKAGGWSDGCSSSWCGIVIVAALAACHGDRAGPAIAHHVPVPTGSPIERAHAYERGTGVARNYRAAAELYRAACDDGRGDLVACGALIRASMRHRGADFDQAALHAFASKICVDRRDVYVCVAADLLSGGERNIPAPVMAVIMDVLGHMPECDAAHLTACEAQLLGSALDRSDGSSAQARKATFHRRLCRLRFVEGCQQMLRSSYFPDGDPERIAARQWLGAACDEGDADACMASPDRKPVPPKQLCAADDYEACGAAGCRGDAEAAQLAASHGVTGGDDCSWLIREHERESSP